MRFRTLACEFARQPTENTRQPVDNHWLLVGFLLVTGWLATGYWLLAVVFYWLLVGFLLVTGWLACEIARQRAISTGYWLAGLPLKHSNMVKQFPVSVLFRCPEPPKPKPNQHLNSHCQTPTKPIRAEAEPKPSRSEPKPSRSRAEPSRSRAATEPSRAEAEPKPCRNQAEPSRGPLGFRV